MLDQRANHAKASLERRSMLTFEHQTPCLSGGRRWREKTGVGFSVGQASANANERVTDGQQPEYLFATFYLRDNAHFSQQKESGRKSFGQKESMDSRKPVLTVLSLPVMRNLNGDPVGHARAELHVKLDPKHAQEGIALDRNWGVSFSVPRKNHFERFERYFSKTIKEEVLVDNVQIALEEIEAKRAELSRVLEANGTAIGINDLPEVWMNKPSQKKNYLSRLLRDGDTSLPFPVTKDDADLRRSKDPTTDWHSIEEIEEELEQLIELRNGGIELARMNRDVVKTVLEKYLKEKNVRPAEQDQESLLDELIRDNETSAELVCLEPLREAVREQGGQRIFIGIDTIMRALDPSNGGDAVYDGDFYACFPPAGDLQPANDPGEYLDFNVKAGLVGARTRVRRGEERWVILVIERNTLIGILASVEQYRNTDAIEEILRTIGEI